MSSKVSEQKLEEEKKVDVKFKSTVSCMLIRISLKNLNNLILEKKDQPRKVTSIFENVHSFWTVSIVTDCRYVYVWWCGVWCIYHLSWLLIGIIISNLGQNVDTIDQAALRNQCYWWCRQISYAYQTFFHNTCPAKRPHASEKILKRCFRALFNTNRIKIIIKRWQNDLQPRRIIVCLVDLVFWAAFFVLCIFIAHL